VITLDTTFAWREAGAIAEGSTVALSARAESRIRHARSLVESIVERGIRAYGVNTGVGALCEVIVDRSHQQQLSHNIVMSHAAGAGPLLGVLETRAIIAAAVNNLAHGYSGVRLEVVEALIALLNRDCVPEVPAGGSVGYLSHMAHIASVLLGAGHARVRGERCPALEALRAIGLEPLLLEAKEGLSLVNGTPCATGLFTVALLRLERLLEWADGVAAMTVENLHGQPAAFDAEALALRSSPGVARVGAGLRALLEGSALLAAGAGRRTQDALSLRAIPQVHGAVRDVFEVCEAVLDRELASVSDNPVVLGTPQAPRVISEAHAVGTAIGLSADALGTAVAQLAAMAERRIDRLVNPLVSNLPAFLADGAAASGFMLAQYTAVSLVAENRRLAAPASLDGGVTSGLQEDHLAHATPAALKLLHIIDNAETVLAIELLAAAQAYDLQTGPAPAPATVRLWRAVRTRAAHYRDDRPLAPDIGRARELLRTRRP
jgi:histidine ammonia-lyase